MVPVDVERQRVEVERAKVTVERQDLENKAQFESIARGACRLTWPGSKPRSRCALPWPTPSAPCSNGHAKMTVWGDADTVSRMSESFFKGQQFGYP
ncbi:MAG: hypothetical protein U0075_08850 [Thermomicrobiales bacterium]